LGAVHDQEKVCLTESTGLSRILPADCLHIFDWKFDVFDQNDDY
jgi:hypothetical protein